MIQSFNSDFFLSIQGGDALPDVHPLEQFRKGKKRTNTTQLTPYTGKDMEELQPLYERAKVAWRPVLDWIENTVRLVLLSYVAILFSDTLSSLDPYLSSG